MTELLTSSLACLTPLARPPEHHHLTKVWDEAKRHDTRDEKKIKKELRKNKKELINNNNILSSACELMHILVYHL